MLALVSLLFLGITLLRPSEAKAQPPQQYPIMDKVAGKIIQKYQTSTCEQLWMKKSEKTPPTAEEQRVIGFLKSDPQMRAAFINRLLLSLVALSPGTENAHAQRTTQTPPKKTTPKTKPVAATVATKPALEPKAIELLKASCARLAAAHSMSFTAEVTYESPSRMGFPLAYTTKSEVVVQRPDKLRVLTLGDGPASEFTTTVK